MVFFESFSQKVFEEAVGRKVEFVQDNHSKSCKGVLRGLHYQLEPYAQGKLVRCVAGEVLMLRLIFVNLRQRLGNGLVSIFLLKINDNFGSLKGLHTDFGVE